MPLLSPPEHHCGISYTRPASEAPAVSEGPLASSNEAVTLKTETRSAFDERPTGISSRLLHPLA